MPYTPENISAGTQVVALVEVRGTNHALVHPRGAVGVVTRTPTGDQHQFLVRFPDGFEQSFDRAELGVQNGLKSRLPELPNDAARAALHDLLVRVRIRGLSGS